MKTTHRTRPSSGLATGFTLVETLIAIGALLLISLGLAQIFDATTRTVTVGRRVSVMTEYAALLETRFRADFDGMTRDGFLIIRNEYANVGDPVPLHADERASDARRRRIDEMMFFVKGSVSSAREAMAAGFEATSSEAAIYYGHGQQRREIFSKNSFYRRPQVYDFNSESQDQLGFNTPGNPNRYASSWNLLRHVTVLAQPATSVTKVFGTAPGMTALPAGISNQNFAVDADHQIGLLPAASSLFRGLATWFPDPAASLGLYAGAKFSPQISSGIVDIATTDLAEIRQIITTVNAPAGDVRDPSRLQSLMQPGRMSSLGFMQQWMDDALPAWSMGPVRDRSRMRGEPTAPDFMGVLEGMQGSPSGSQALRNAIDRANQMAVASSVFVPSCTEFIVEWSFGKVDTTTGQLIWHGKERRVDFDGDGSLNDEIPVAFPYLGSLPGDLMTIPFKIRAPRGIVAENSGQANPAGIDEWLVSPQLIHGGTGGKLFSQSLTSYFGYYDPFFNPDLRASNLNPFPPNSVGPLNPNGDDNDAGDALSPTIPWAWPELIRITLTLADPIDPTFEQSFQFVLDAPGNPVY